MSRMLDNLARALRPEEEAAPQQSPDLTLVEGGGKKTPGRLPVLRGQMPGSGKTLIILGALLVTATVAVSIFIRSRSIQPASGERTATQPFSRQQQEAVEALRSGDPVKAARLFTSLLESRQDSKVLRLNLGYALKAQGKFEEAREQYLEGIRRFGEDSLLLNNLGVLYSAMGLRPQAEAALKKSLEINSGFTDARLNLARHLEREQKLNPALEQYRILVQKGGDGDALGAEIRERSRKLHSLQAGRTAEGEKL